MIKFKDRMRDQKSVYSTICELNMSLYELGVTSKLSL